MGFLGFLKKKQKDDLEFNKDSIPKPPDSLFPDNNNSKTGTGLTIEDPIINNTNNSVIDSSSNRINDSTNNPIINNSGLDVNDNITSGATNKSTIGGSIGDLVGNDSKANNTNNIGEGDINNTITVNDDVNTLPLDSNINNVSAPAAPAAPAPAPAPAAPAPAPAPDSSINNLNAGVGVNDVNNANVVDNGFDLPDLPDINNINDFSKNSNSAIINNNNHQPLIGQEKQDLSLPELTDDINDNNAKINDEHLNNDLNNDSNKFYEKPIIKANKSDGVSWNNDEIKGFDKEIFIAADDFLKQQTKIKELKRSVKETDNLVKSWDELEIRFIENANKLFTTINQLQERLIVIDTDLFER